MADTSVLMGTELKTFPQGYYGYSYTENRIDDGAEKIATIFQVPGACSLTGAMIYVTQITGTSPTYKYTLQGVDGSGEPDGVVKATTAEFTPTSPTMQKHSFTTPYSATQGEVLAVVIEYGSGTINGSNRARFRDRIAYTHNNIFPYTGFKTGGSWGWDWNEYPSMAVITDQTWDVGGIAWTFSDTIGPTSTNGVRYTQKMLIPDGENVELHVTGFKFAGRVMADTSAPADGPYKAGIWAADGTELASVTVDGDQQAVFPMSTSYSRDYLFTSTATVTDGVPVFLGFERIDGGTNLQVTRHAFGASGSADTAGLKSWPGQDAFFFASFAAGGAITEDKTRRLLLNPILSSIHSDVVQKLGKGDRGPTFRDPSRNNSRKPNYQVNRGKIIGRENAGFGWDPYG